MESNIFKDLSNHPHIIQTIAITPYFPTPQPFTPSQHRASIDLSLDILPNRLAF